MGRTTSTPSAGPARGLSRDGMLCCVVCVVSVWVCACCRTSPKRCVQRSFCWTGSAPAATAASKASWSVGICARSGAHRQPRAWWVHYIRQRCTASSRAQQKPLLLLSTPWWVLSTVRHARAGQLDLCCGYACMCIDGCTSMFRQCRRWYVASASGCVCAQ